MSEPTIGQVQAVLIGRAKKVPLGGVLRNAGMRDCSEYNAYMWAVREIASAVEELKAAPHQGSGKP